ncbi:MAG: DUF3179 domain-containing protein [Planctomycetota bacterium]
MNSKWLWIPIVATSILIGYIVGNGFRDPSNDREAEASNRPPTTASSQRPEGPPDELAPFFTLIGPNTPAISEAFTAIDEQWQPGTAIMLLELCRFAQNPTTVTGTVKLLKKKYEVDRGNMLQDWMVYVWGLSETQHPLYVKFKKRLYSFAADPRFAEYFETTDNAQIKLEEIQWGGVLRDGIPPLVDPDSIEASEADYLADTDVVFGIAIGDQAKAYPKRILGWHELVRDTVGDKTIAGVYCTLCGSMIAYDPTDSSGTFHELGTSGFLYRSNKLMYDTETKSMWSTLQGKPVVGPLVGKEIKLDSLPVVTTTWGEWKKRHPETKVVSLETGHMRDYGEGVAYREYFATDDLMFFVPKADDRLKNKDEVFVIRVGDLDSNSLAVKSDFLMENPVYQTNIGEQSVLILTDESGANRAYAWNDATPGEYDGKTLTVAEESWQVTEDALVHADGQKLARMPAHRAFWFAWVNQYPETVLVK